MPDNYQWRTILFDLKRRAENFLAGNDDTIRAKLILAVFDKLILGALVLGIASIVQSNLSKGQLRAELTAKFVELRDGQISERRDSLFRAVGVFSGALNEANSSPETLSQSVAMMNEALQLTGGILEDLKTSVSGTKFDQSGFELTSAMAASSTYVSSTGIEALDRAKNIKQLAAEIRQAALDLRVGLDQGILAAAKKSAEEVY